MDIVIIGSGNVASVLGRKILANGHHIKGVVARNEKAGKTLAEGLNTIYSQDLSIPVQTAQLYIAAISDNGLPVLSQLLKVKRAVVVHTAGSVAMDVLKTVSPNYGVLYPLQTLSSDMEEIPPFPLLVDGSTPDILTFIRDFAETISDQVITADDEYRRRIHMAAVISGNFTNHLFALVQDYCREEGLDFKLLLPQIHQIVRNLETGHAAKRQTGPALRNDGATLNRHLNMLEQFPEIKDIYNVLTASIRNYHNKKYPS